MKIKDITYFEIEKLNSAFSKVYQQDLPIAGIKTVKNILDKFDVLMGEEESLKKELAERYGAKDKNGKLKITPDPKKPGTGMVQFETDEQEQKYLSELQQLKFQKNDIEVPLKMDFDQFEQMLVDNNVKLSGNDLALIQAFFEYSESKQDKNDSQS